MKQVEHTTELRARPDQLFDYLLDDEFVSALQAHLERVSEIEPHPPQKLDDGRIRRVCRFTAPTQLPRALRRFKGKAPPEVHWDQIWIADPEDHRIATEIVADAPDHWHDYYQNHGEILLERLDDKRSRLTQQLSFELDAPMGMGMFLNRSIKSVVEDIFDAQAHVLQDHVGDG